MDTPTTPTGKPKRLELSKIPTGEYVRLSSFDKGSVWIKGEYSKESKAYSLTKADDVNHVIFRKGTFSVFLGFTY